jgi:hypothetical protein
VMKLVYWGIVSPLGVIEFHTRSTLHHVIENT